MKLLLFLTCLVLPAAATPQEQEIRLPRHPQISPDGETIAFTARYEGPADVFAEMKTLMGSLDNISWERLLDESAVTYPCDAPDRPGNDIVFGDGFPTPSGRAPPSGSPPTRPACTRWCATRGRKA